MKAITDSKSSEAQASSFMDQSGTTNSVENCKSQFEHQESFVKIYSLDFLVELPPISALDLDVLKLTAQFAAKNGKQFILHLSQKESRNPQFDFLKPNHNLHSFYQDLVKQNLLILNPPKELLERVKICAFSKSEHLKLVKQRAQIERIERQRVFEQEAAENAEMEAFSKIDWHDFTVAETVNFGPEDQHTDFPPPLSVHELQAMPMTQRLEMWSGKRTDKLPITAYDDDSNDEEEMEIDEPSDFSAPMIMPQVMAKPNEIIMGAAFGSGAPIKVRTDYVPRAFVTSASHQNCTICNASVPISQIEEHVRIELLDPKWRTQRLAMMSKNRESNLVETGTDVSKNLEALARHRSDIFSPAGSSATSTSSIERGPTRPIWDGHADSVGKINRAAQILAKPQIEKEMEALQRAGDYSLDPSKGIGPRAPSYPSVQASQSYPMPQASQGYPIPSQTPQGYPMPPQAPQGFPLPPQVYPMPPQGFPVPPQGYHIPPQRYPIPPQGYPMLPQGSHGHPVPLPPGLPGYPPQPQAPKKSENDKK